MILIIFCALFLCGCQPDRKYTTHTEYVENHEWDREKGLVKSWKTSVDFEWD
jgi:hypothetical protein